ncbi:TetR/AcrR family transcriptional regulator [Enterococcus durans]|uniref:TetR/AcrR family transcriptional regulator n=1 Tax=Enterococcus TaxID=1350 RepID=UPI00288E0B72|nr:TetR/AcrR family transcriptional regulator [Enterococcus durans]MDT2835546.1 TetR/AcrR family transcriptional regulator [Enterococcus durans]
MGPQEVKIQKLRQIYQALLHLLQKKELIDISISELCKAARVSRTYYYRNFHSLQDIILRYKSWKMSAYLRRTQHAKEVKFITLMTVYFKL